MANHSGNAQTAFGHRAVCSVVAVVKIRVCDDSAARDFIKRDVFSSEIGRTGHHHGVAYALRILQRPAQRLHAAQAAAHNSGQGLYAERIHQTRLRIDPVLHRDDRKICAVNLTRVGVGLHRPGGAKTRAKIVDTNHKKLICINRLSGADHGVPPAFRLFDHPASRVNIHARHMVRSIERVANQHRIRFVCVQRAVGLITQVISTQRRATLQRQGLVKVHGLRSGYQHLVCIENKKTRHR